jgi:peptidoglycan-associated lipoprotein
MIMFRFNGPHLLILSLSIFFVSCSTTKQDKPSPSGPIGLSETVFDDGSTLNFGPDAGNLKTRNGKFSNELYNGKQMILDLFDPIYFTFDSMAVDGTQRPILLNAVTYLKENPGYEILIKGRCDWYGTEEYNLTLGDLRANSVALYMEDLGIQSGRIHTVSIGSLEAQIGLSKSKAQIDRRADLILLK